MRRALTVLVLLTLPLGAGAADVYRSVDAQGHVQYSDVPTPGAQLVAVSDAQADTSAANGSSSDDQALEKQSRDIHDRLTAEAAARAVQQDMAQRRAQQCKQAQDAYQRAIQARRLYRMGPDGQRQFLNDEQADQQRVADRMAMESACKQSS